MAGTIVADTIQDGAGNSTSMDNAIYGSAKAWVNFNGNVTASIRTSYNFSSITRNSLGNYTFAFTNALTDANYCMVTGCRGVSGGYSSTVVIANNTTPTSSGFTVECFGGTTTGTDFDPTYGYIAIFR
jgi:hypothetical protein